jgi:putative cell wall-binding protein
LLVAKDSVPAATATELGRLDPSQIVVVGGTGVISNQVMNDLEAYVS